MKKQEVPLSSIEGKTTCLFFSAHWCRPCRNFTPNLVQIYTALRNTGKNIEIIFISLDRDDASFWDHFKGMPWLALPFDTGLRQKLCAHFGIEQSQHWSLCQQRHPVGWDLKRMQWSWLTSMEKMHTPSVHRGEGSWRPWMMPGEKEVSFRSFLAARRETMS